MLRIEEDIGGRGHTEDGWPTHRVRSRRTRGSAGANQNVLTLRRPRNNSVLL